MLTYIAAKYTEYENLRAIIEGKAPPHEKSKSKSQAKSKARKRSDSSHQPPQTPSKKRVMAVVETPRHNKQNEEEDVLNPTPQQPKLLMLGPTPQKNGIFISMINQLPPETPFQTKRSSRQVLGEVPNNASTSIPLTPSKKSPSGAEFTTPSKVANTPVENSNSTRTPMSSGRRFLLGHFATPGKRKRPEAEQSTPESIKRFRTPAFFRAYTMPEALEPVEEEEQDEARERRPRSFGLPGLRRPFLKTLSSMIKERKKEAQAEEQDREREEMDRLDEEEDLLRELEDDMEAAINGGGDLDRDGFLDNDVARELNEIDKAEDEAAEKSGFIRRVFKKRGLKRQTRRVISRFHEYSLGLELTDLVRPTRNVPNPTTEEPEHEESNDESGSEHDEDDALIDTIPAKKSTKEPVKAPAKSTKKGPDRNNYRRLKIKSKNSKGKGRFGRRR
jgi:hypothetical protein